MDSWRRQVGDIALTELHFWWYWWSSNKSILHFIIVLMLQLIWKTVHQQQHFRQRTVSHWLEWINTNPTLVEMKLLGWFWLLCLFHKNRLLIFPYLTVQMFLCTDSAKVDIFATGKERLVFYTTNVKKMFQYFFKMSTWSVGFQIFNFFKNYMWLVYKYFKL